MNIESITPETLRRAADLKEQIDGLSKELAAILGNGSNGPETIKPATNTTRPLQYSKPKIHWTQTPEGRKKMARSMRRRWKRGEF